MSQISIRPATVADTDAICAVMMEAQEPLHEFYELFFKDHPRNLAPIAMRQALAKPDKFTFFVAEEEKTDGSASRDIVGYVRYTIVGAADAAGESTSAPAPPVSTVWDRPGHMEQLWEQFNADQNAAEAVVEEVIAGRRHLWVQQVMILPDRQRQGIGKKLLQKALDEADAQGVPSILTSSEKGYGLYVRLGFASLAEFLLDNGAWTVKVLEHLKSLGMSRDETLAEKYRGTVEKGWAMIREVPK
ncbi:unnamed protein product [Clonostachys rhizophaga]|uniref:N-acetyltransferase domain-containing protein n=1 Tax=Clonostachys rhizophaga TaxID=160324 RepID=A0A9N9VZG4_9HYPO|nr:unnamed protein product [Clonostachys rhizophaga]